MVRRVEILRRLEDLGYTRDDDVTEYKFTHPVTGKVHIVRILQVAREFSKADVDKMFKDMPPSCAKKFWDNNLTKSELAIFLDLVGETNVNQNQTEQI
jgi:hypothetical protein